MSNAQLSEREQLKKAIADTLREIDEMESLDIDDIDMGRLGWLENHLAVLRNRLNGKWVDTVVVHYEILEQ